MEAALSLEASATIYQSMWPNAPEDLNLQVKRRCVRATSLALISNTVQTLQRNYEIFHDIFKFEVLIVVRMKITFCWDVMALQPNFHFISFIVHLYYYMWNIGHV
jgi:hypothetical protein